MVLDLLILYNISIKRYGRPSVALCSTKYFLPCYCLFLALRHTDISKQRCILTAYKSKRIRLCICYEIFFMICIFSDFRVRLWFEREAANRGNILMSFDIVGRGCRLTDVLWKCKESSIASITLVGLCNSCTRNLLEWRLLTFLLTAFLVYTAFRLTCHPVNEKNSSSLERQTIYCIFCKQEASGLSNK